MGQSGKQICVTASKFLLWMPWVKFPLTHRGLELKKKKKKKWDFVFMNGCTCNRETSQIYRLSQTWRTHPLHCTQNSIPFNEVQTSELPLEAGAIQLVKINSTGLHIAVIHKPECKTTWFLVQEHEQSVMQMQPRVQLWLNYWCITPVNKRSLGLRYHRTVTLPWTDYSLS